ncbi:MAG: ATP-binding protein [Candidatus Saccharibacteria bacterium]|nr:ATP-binding protein [Candidatus Saccharibacteria bacterium]
MKNKSLRKLFAILVVAIAGLAIIAVSFQYAAVSRTQQVFDSVINNNVQRVQTLHDLRHGVSSTVAFISLDSVSEDEKLQAIEQNKIKAQQDVELFNRSIQNQRGNIHVVNISDTESLLDNFYRQATLVVNNQLPLQQLRQTQAQFNDLISDSISLEMDNLSEDRRSVDSETTELARQSIIAAMLPVLVTVIASLLAGMLIVRRLTNIKTGADRIASGDFSRPIPVESEDEIGQVENAFNQMAVRLRDSYQRIALEKRRDEALLKSMSEGMIAVDKKEEIVLINDNAVELLHIESEDKLVGSNIDHVLELKGVDGHDIDKKQHPVQQALKSSSIIEDVYSVKLASKHKLDINVSVSPVEVDGETHGAIIVLRDVTKDREVDRMKTEFISLASHQLRTPLSAIKWFSEMLLAGDAGKLKKEQSEFAQNIYDSTDRMIELVNSLLNISRIESGRIIIDPVPTDLSQLVNSIVTELKQRADEKEQKLLISAHKNLPKINIDPKLVRQVYLNLLTNAIKYTPKGGEISVFISRKDDHIISQVTDNGYGIPKAQHKKVFQKFFRAENIVKIETDGNGLGMYLVKSIVESSGGKIWFESEEGKGTTFWFTLPMSGMQAKEGEVSLD